MLALLPPVWLLPGGPAPPTPEGLWAVGGSLGAPVSGDPRLRAISWGWRCKGSLGGSTVHASSRFLLGVGQLAQPDPAPWECMVGQARGVPTAEHRRLSIRAQVQGGRWTVTAKVVDREGSAGKVGGGGHPGPQAAQVQRIQGSLGGMGFSGSAGRGSGPGLMQGSGARGARGLAVPCDCGQRAWSWDQCPPWG